MTDSSDTTPPPGPLPSVLPHEPIPLHVEVAHAGKALDALDVLDRYFKSKFDGDVADALKRQSEREHAERDAYRKEIRDALAAAAVEREEIKTMINDLGNQILEYVQRVVAVDFRLKQHENGNVHCEHKDCPLSSRALEG